MIPARIDSTQSFVRASSARTEISVIVHNLTHPIISAAPALAISQLILKFAEVIEGSYSSQSHPFRRIRSYRFLLFTYGSIVSLKLRWNKELALAWSR
jgi:hypothetical protein